jgi:hypothetical protein
MLTDALLNFVPIGGNLSLVAGAGVPIISPNVIDLLGLGVGVAPTSIIGNASVFGEDPGVGGLRPELQIGIGTAVVANAAGSLLKIALQAAADPGAAGNYTPAANAWQDVVSQDNISPTNLTANAIPFRCPWIPTMPPNLRPRFLRLWFGGSVNGNFNLGSFSAGTIAYALVTTVRDDQSNKFAAKNFAVS